ncbi:MAG: hypothetical protein ACOZCO_06800 [Bacteroidota bacterium]
MLNFLNKPLPYYLVFVIYFLSGIESSGQVFPDTLNQKPPKNSIVLHELTGETIDSLEKTQYHLFPYWKKDEFLSARIFQLTDNTFEIEGKMKNGTSKTVYATKNDIDNMCYQVSFHAGKITKKPATATNLENFDGLIDLIIQLAKCKK